MAELACLWIEELRQYIPYQLPDGSSLYEKNFNKMVSCCKCGKKIKFGDCYTSREVHNSIGMGYAECGDYYFKGLDNEKTE